MDYISIDEQETVIEFYRTDDMLDIYTSDQTMITKLKKLLMKSDEYKVLREEKSSDGRTLTLEVTAPKDFLTLKSKRRETAELTDEERESLANRMRAINEKNQALREEMQKRL